eukprot:gene9151-16818_t
MEDPRTILEEKLPVVLDIILTRPNQIVDDTYIEKLLTWLNTIASEKDNGDFLLNPKTNILQFLLSEPVRLLESPICANFALRLVGLVGGSSSDACEMLIDDGILENLFGRYQLNENLFVKSAVTRFAFFEGLSSMLGNSFAYSWVLKKNGFVCHATKAFTDSSFYVSASAKRFLATFLLAAKTFDSKLDDGGKDTILKAISIEYKKASLKDKQQYLDLVSQIFDSDMATAIQLLESFGGLQSFMHHLHLKRKGSKLLQTVTEICYKLLSRGCKSHPGHVFSKSLVDADEDLEIIEILLSVAVSMAKEDVGNLFYFLTKTICIELNTLHHWNELALCLVLSGILHWKVDTLTITSNWFCEGKWEYAGFQYSELSIRLTKDLKSIMEKHLIEKKSIKESCSKEGMSLVEMWTQFLSDLMVITPAKAKGDLRLELDAELVAACTGCRNLAYKCATAIEQILINDWFSGFTAQTKFKVINAVVKTINDQTLDTQTLSAGIKLFSCLVDKIDDKITSEAIQGHMEADSSISSTCEEDHWFALCPDLPTVLRKLIIDNRWEVRDSTLDMISVLVTKAKGDECLCEFLLNHQFWLESLPSLDADESYLRATTVRFIGIILENQRTRLALFSHTELNMIFEKLLVIFKEDDEAFPKRSLMEAMYRWLDLAEVEKILLYYGSELTGKSETQFAAKLCDLIFNLLDISYKSFDWEVKLKAVQCWLKILKMPYKISSDFSDNSPTDTHIGVLPLSLLCSKNGATNLVIFLNDCDQLVREAALKTLQYIREKELHASNAPITNKKVIESCYDIETIGNISFSSREEFIAFLGKIDFQLLAQSIKLADESVTNNPLSLLDDIISAAKNSDDNLLDCY